MKESIRQSLIDAYYESVDKELTEALARLGYSKDNIHLLKGRLHMVIREGKTTYYLDDAPLVKALPFENYLEERT
jgi:hypothetical protein